MQISQGRSAQIKKLTWIKVQFYIGIQLRWDVFEQLWFSASPILQGVKEKGVFMLTDPAIHSAIGDFGRDNKRAMGMAKFFETHVCNSICEQLKLTKQKWRTQLYLTLFQYTKLCL